VRLEEIKAAEWALRLGALGEIVQGADEVEQCLRVILGTPKGSVPLDPDFGCDAWRWIDAPGPQAYAAVVREVADAIRLYEPRAELVQVMTVRAAERLTLRVQWRRTGSSALRTLEVAP